uniref:Mesoderm posterior ab n=1 Tax=Cyprinus carpio TaxID=7962 RepID=A0A8C2GUE5_CYPCA
MELNFSPYMLQGAKCQFEYERSSTTIDAGYFSACGSLSPSSSIDSRCFSPPVSCWGAGRQPEAAGKNDIDCRRSRSKYPGTKRQTASEREKLRMRDLTKALHHLQIYLPPSVAPPGQTLTKIETLRLTISYISYLSALLEQSEETSNHETTPRYLQDTSKWSAFRNLVKSSYSFICLFHSDLITVLSFNSFPAQQHMMLQTAISFSKEEHRGQEMRLPYAKIR